jgi:hypothetical protein
MAEGFPIEPGTPAEAMAAQFGAESHDPELPMQRRMEAADNYRELTCGFDEIWATDPKTGERYLARTSYGLCYSGPDDLVGFYDF